jgi:abortive infection bacteriophage resistance protein
MCPRNLTNEEQRELFAKRGIIFEHGDPKRDASKIQEIGYYKLKDFAYPFSHVEHSELVYSNLTFYDLLKRYYQDKNFRIYVLHAIEDIEVYLNSVVASVLGNRYGAFGYLDFKQWCNRSINKFKIEELQYHFKKDLLKKIKRINIPDLEFKNNLDKDGFPSVWLMVNCLTFGNTIHLFLIMSKRNQEKVALFPYPFQTLTLYPCRYLTIICPLICRAG